MLYESYKIQQGDTLGRLAKKWKTNLKAIQGLNPSIKDVNKIYIGQTIRYPKIILPPSSYEKEFDAGMERLYKGVYGTTGGREKLGEELVKRYPGVDVWKDIYEKIPNFWEKIAFPETVKLPSQLPETKLPAWQKVGSFISEKIKIPVQQKVETTAWKIFSKIPYIPSPQEVYEQAKLKVRDEILIPHKERLEEEREKQLGLQVTGVIKYTKPVMEELKVKAKESYEELNKKVEKKLDIKGWPYLGPYLLKKDIKRYEGEMDFLRAQREAKKGLDMEAVATSERSAIGYYRVIEDSIFKRQEELKKSNIILGIDSYGWIFADTKKSEAASKKYSENFAKEWEKVFGGSDPYINEFLDNRAKAQTTQNNLLSYLIGDLNYLKTVLTSPALAKGKNEQALLKNLNQIIETSSFLESIDPTLVDIESELDRHNRSAVDVKKYYEEEVPKWWSEVEVLIGKEITDKMRSSEQLTEVESNKLTTVLTGLPISKLNQYQSLIKRIAQSQVFYNIEGNLSSLILQPHSLDALVEIYRQHPQASAGRLTVIQKAIKDQEWWEENKSLIDNLEKDKIPPFFKKLSEALSPEQFEKLRDDITSNDTLTKKQIDLALEVINYTEERMKNIEFMEGKLQELGKAAKIYKRYTLQTKLKQEKERGQKIDKAMNTSAWRTVLFPVTDATWEDYKVKMGSALGNISDKIDPKTKKVFSYAWETADHAIELLYFKYLVPTINTSLTVSLEQMKYIGQELVLSDIPLIQKTGDWTIKKYQAWKAVFGGVPLKDLEKQLPQNIKDRAVKDQWELLQNIFKYYSSPEAYDEITVDKDTRIDFTEDTVKIGTLRIEAFKNREHLILWNPHLKDSRFIKKGTKITIPKWVKGPRFTDMLTDDKRYKFYQEHPGQAILLDEFMPFLMLPNIEILLWTQSRLGGIRLAQAYGKKIAGVQSIQKAKTVWGKSRAAEAVNNSMIMTEQILKMISFKPVDWRVFGQNKIIESFKVPIKDFRAGVAQTTIINSLPSSISQSTISVGLDESKKMIDIVLLNSQATSILDEALGKLGLMKDFKRRFNLALFDPSIVPDEKIQKVFREMGWSTYDLLEYGKRRPELKKIAEELFVIAKSREPAYRGMAWSMEYQKLSEQGKDFFMNVVYKDWKRPKGYSKITSDALLEKFRIEYLKTFKNHPNFKKIKEEVGQAHFMLKHYLKETNLAREIGEKTKVKIRLPINVDLVPAETLKQIQELQKLKKKGFLSFDVKTQRLRFVFNPKAYPRREYEVFDDLMDQFLDFRWKKYGEIPIGEAGVRMFTKKHYVKKIKPGKGALPYKEKTVIESVLKKEQKTFYVKDAIVTDWIEHFWMKPGRDKIKDFLSSRFKVKKGTQTIRVTTEQTDWTERMTVNILAGKDFEPFKIKRVPVLNTKERISDKGIKFFMKRAATLDFMKGTPEGRRQLGRYREYLKSVTGNLETDVTRLDDLLIKEYGFSPILPTTSQILLLEDATIASNLNILKAVFDTNLKSFAKRQYDRIRAAWKVEKKKEKLEPYKLLLDSQDFGDEIKDVQNLYKLGFKDAEINQIIPKIYGYIPVERLKEGELTKVVKQAIEIASNQVRENLTKALRGSKKELELQSKELLTKDFPWTENVIKWFTLKEDKGILTAEEIFKIKQIQRQNKRILVANMTAKDRAVIKYCTKNGVDFQIFVPPSAKEMIITPSQILKTLKNRGDGIFNPGNIFSDESFLRLLGHFSAARYEMMREFPTKIKGVPMWYGKAERLTKIQVKENAKNRLHQAIVQELTTTERGKDFLKRLQGLEGKKLIAALKEKTPIEYGKFMETVQDFGISITKETFARPFGIVSQKDIPPSFFNLMEKYLSGSLTELKTNGIRIFYKKGKPIEARLTNDFVEKSLEFTQSALAEGDGPMVGRLIPKIAQFIKDGTPVPKKSKEILSNFCNYLRLDTFQNFNAFRKYTSVLERISKLRGKEQDLLKMAERIENQIDELNLLSRVVEKEKRLILSKKMGELHKKIFAINKDIDKVKSQIDNFEDVAGRFLIDGGNPLFPGYASDTMLKLIFEGKSRALDTLFEIDKKIELLKKSRLAFNKKIKITQTLPLVQKILNIDTEIKKLKSLRNLIPNLKKLEDIGFKITEKELYNYGRGSVSKLLANKLGKAEYALLKKAKPVPSPIYLDDTAKQLFDAFPEIQQRIKNIRISKEPTQVLIKKFIGDFKNQDYLLPLLEIQKNPIDSKLLTKQLEYYVTKRFQVVLDLDNSFGKAGLQEAKELGLKVISFPDFKKLSFITKYGELPSPEEIKVFLKLRDIFFRERKIVLWSSDQKYLSEVKERFLNTFISKDEKRIIDAAQDLMKHTQTIPKPEARGLPFKFAVRKHLELKTKEMDKAIAISTVKKLEPEKAVEYLASKYTVDNAFQKVLNNVSENGIWKELYEIDNFAEKVPTIILGTASKFISEANLKKLETAFKFQKARLILPKNLTPGEQTIKEFLDMKKIPYSRLLHDLKSEYLLDPLKSKLAIEISKTYPTFVLPMGTKFDKARSVFVGQADKSFRIFKPLEQLQSEVLKVVSKNLLNWIYSSRKEIPLFVELHKYGLRKDPKTLMIELMRLAKRRDAKKFWRQKKDLGLEIAKRDWLDQFLKEAGVKNKADLSKIQKTWLKTRYNQVDDVGYMLEKVCGWDKPAPWFERIETRVAEKLKLNYVKNRNFYSKDGFPVTGTKDHKILIQSLETTLKVLEGGKGIFRGTKSVFGSVRSAWILAILVWRLAWHLKNNYDDSVKIFLKTKSLKNFVYANALFANTTAQFTKHFIRDLRNVPKFVNNPSAKELLELKRIFGKKFSETFNKLAKEADVPYEPFNPSVLMRAKEIKNWKKFSPVEKIEAVKNNPLYLDLALKEGPIFTPKGERLTPELSAYITETGLFQMFADPIERRLALSTIKETASYQRLWKRAYVLNADLEAWANFSEGMRRQILMHDLIFNKAMSLAEAKAQTWRWLFNYRDLSIVGKSFRKFFPFYAFNSKSFVLWTTEIAKGGVERVMAARAFMDAWSASTQELPEWARQRIPIGGRYYWYPWCSFFQVAEFWQDPKKMLRDFIENPLAVPLGFAWDPFYTTLISEITKKKFYDISTDFKREAGFTEAQIEKIIEKEKLTRDLSLPEKAQELLTTFLPFTKLAFTLGEVDRYMLMDGTSVWKSKKFKAFAMQFGLNIIKWEDMDIAMSALFDTPPHLQKEKEKEIKKENPEAWEAMQRYFAKTSFIKAAELGKTDPEAATLYLKQRGYLSQYYEMEWKKPGSGNKWLERNKDAKETIGNYFEAKDAINPWKMIQRSRYNRGLIASQARILVDKTYPEETVKKAEEDLGIDINFAVVGSKEDFQKMLFDEHGKLKISSMQELEAIMGQEWTSNIINKTRKTWQEYIKQEAEVNYHEWLYIKEDAKTKEEKDYADRMAKWQKFLPKDINQLSDKEAQHYWNKYWIYFEKFFSDDEKTKYYLGLQTKKGEWYYEYRQKMQEYIQIWGEMFKKFDSENYQFYNDFYSQPDWWQNLYFRENPNKKKWFPFARKWVGMLEKIRDQEEKGIFNEKERKAASDYFWRHESLVKLWDKDNPGFYNYMKRWQAVIQLSEASPEEYYPAFYSQPLSFRERFFKKNPEARIYYPFVYKWTQLIQQDQKNLEETGERTRLSNNWFWCPENKRKRELYGKNRKIDETHTILDYLTIQKDNWNEVGGNIKIFYSVFFSSPDWYQKIYLNKNPEKKKYYWFAYHLGLQPADVWSDYFWTEGVKFNIARRAWDKENPGFLDYMSIWKRLGNLAKKGDWNTYFKVYWSPNNLEFRTRHWKSHPEAKKRYSLMRKYQEFPSKTWEDRKAKRDFLRANPSLKEWWAKNISEEDAKLSTLVEEYYKIVDSVPEEGKGLDYYILVRKKELEGERFKRENPEMVAYLHKNAEKETGEKPEIFNLLSQYSELTLPDEKQEFLKEHPEVKKYFLNSKPPGIRAVIKLQDQYFTLPEKQKSGFLVLHPELVGYWESRKLPESYFFNPTEFAPYNLAVEISHNYFQKCLADNWDKAEDLIKILSDIYWNPGETEEAEWMKQKIYRDAMHTWSILAKKDDDIKAIYFFRQLPDWVRDIYYERHPEKQYLSKYPLSRFIEEPLRIEAYVNPELDWAYKMFQKYGRNMTQRMDNQVRKIMIKYGRWEDRSVWSKEKWKEYWEQRSMYLNSLHEYDLAKIPLLRKELERVAYSFPLKLKPKPFKKPRLGVCHIDF
jgi:hypothetical protein